MFTPSLWRMKRFADSVPEMVHLQREMNRGAEPMLIF